MKFVKGHKKMGGRKRGTPNKRTVISNKIEQLIQENFKQLQLDLKTADLKTRLDFYKVMLPYILPKKTEKSVLLEANHTVTTKQELDFSNLTDDELNTLIALGEKVVEGQQDSDNEVETE